MGMAKKLLPEPMSADESTQQKRNCGTSDISHKDDQKTPLQSKKKSAADAQHATR